jgi:two-component system chemotaxis response regulator CheY
MGKTVLSVDDSASIRDLVAFTLEARGYKVEKAEDGAKGLARMKRAGIDLVIADVNMPVMDGITMIKEIRADRRFDGVPIVMLTTEAQKSKMMEGKAAGATGWIVKPFTEDKLAGVVAKLIG